MSSSSGMFVGDIVALQVIVDFVFGEAGGAVEGGPPALGFFLLEAALEADHAAGQAALEFMFQLLELSPPH
jgi:hypothetical protein